MTFRALPFEPVDGSEIWCCALVAAGVSPFFLAFNHYDTPPHPPIERLIGKHPEYVRAYVDAYKKKCDPDS